MILKVAQKFHEKFVKLSKIRKKWPKMFKNFRQILGQKKLE